MKGNEARRGAGGPTTLGIRSVECSSRIGRLIAGVRYNLLRGIRNELKLGIAQLSRDVGLEFAEGLSDARVRARECLGNLLPNENAVLK